MSRSDLEALVEATCTLKRLQEIPDAPEALATIPTLALEDLRRRNKVIPSDARGRYPSALSRSITLYPPTEYRISTSVSTCTYCLPTSCRTSRCSRERFWRLAPVSRIS